MVESGIFYGTFIDPILRPMRKRISGFIEPGKSVLDIACGTGAQVFELSGKVSRAVGVDLSESMIQKALKSKSKKKSENTFFSVGDAGNLTQFRKNEFDIAMMSLALHQFTPKMYTSVLGEMKRVSQKIIIVDYAIPLPQGYVRVGSRWAEFMAGREHYRNFKSFGKNGGLNSILIQNGLVIEKSVLFGRDTFQLVICSPVHK